MEKQKPVDIEFEQSEDYFGEDDPNETNGGITSPFSVNSIRITQAPILLPSLITRLKHNEIAVPEYQREGDLWTGRQMSRLIESILLKLPLPLFYFDVSEPAKWLVIDGLQRISTFRKFFVEEELELNGLEFLTQLTGKKYSDLDRSLHRTIDDTQLLTYQVEAQTPKAVRYSIFNRINTGGLSLRPQEIRQALNQKGGGVEFLSKMAKHEVFKRVVGISSKRMAGQELVLRYMAFQILPDNAFQKMGTFLDKAIQELDSKSPQELNELGENFISVLEFSEEVLGENPKFSRSIVNSNKNNVVNLALFDALTVCLNEVKDRKCLLHKKNFFIDGLKRMLADQGSPLSKAVTTGTSGRLAKETRFREMRNLIAQTVEESS